MDWYPRLKVLAYEAVADGAARTIGMEDLTAPALRAMLKSEGIGPWLGEAPIPVKDIVRSLSSDARRAAVHGRLKLPGLAGEFRSFAEKVHGIGGPSVMRECLESKEMCRAMVREASEMMKDVLGAEVRDSRQFTHFVNPLTGVIQSGTAQVVSWRKLTGPLYEASGWTSDPSTGGAYGDPGDWAGRLVPPFMFGTRRTRWEGLDVLRYAEYVASGGIDLPSFVCGDRASECLEGRLTETWRLDEAAAEFLERRPTCETRQAFADAVRDWNARQSVVLVSPDRSTVVAARPGLDKQDMVEWCREHLLSVIETYNWIGPVPDLPAPGPAMR